MFCPERAGGDHLQRLKPGQTIITVADPHATTPAEAASLRGQLLADEERQNIRRLLRPEQRHERIVAWSLVRLGLSQLFPIPPAEWVFSRRDNQRPFVLAPPGLPPFQFSLSHTRGLIALLVTSAALGGVDVERMERTNDLPSVAPKICAASELAALNLLAGDAWTERFFELWTLKEAYAKARGAEAVCDDASESRAILPTAMVLAIFCWLAYRARGDYDPRFFAVARRKANRVNGEGSFMAQEVRARSTPARH